VGRVQVHSADLDGQQVVKLGVQLGQLPRRTIDRATATAWLRDGHSFVTAGSAPVALQLVGIDGDDGATAWFIRTDNAAEPSDKLPALPRVG
jgi:hypothetical protein